MALFLFVFMLTALVTAAPYIGPEMPVDEQFQGLIDNGIYRQTPRIASDDVNYMVVWASNIGSYMYGTHIYGTRLSPNGLVLDAGVIPISRHPSAQGAPLIIFDGENYLVVWCDARSSEGAHLAKDIYGTRITPDGVVLDKDGFLIHHSPEGLVGPAIASDGVNSLVVWTDYPANGSSGIYGTRISKDRQVLDSDGFTIVNDGISYNEVPAVVFDGTKYLIVWATNRSGIDEDIYGARIKTDGTVLDPDGFAISTTTDDQTSPAIASNGNGFLVVWLDDRNHEAGIYYNIYGTRISAEGTTMDLEGIPIYTDTTDYWGKPVLTYNGLTYLVVLGRAANGVVSTRVTPEGAVLDPDGVQINSLPVMAQYPAVAFNGEEHLIVWGEYDNGDNALIHGAFVSQENVVRETDKRISAPVEGGRYSPVITFDGNDFFAVFESFYNDIDGLEIIEGANIKKEGVLLKADPLSVVTNPPSPGDVFLYKPQPALAYDGNNYMIIWQDFRSMVGNDIYGARISPDGQVLDEVGFAICAETGWQEDAAIAFDGENYLVVWDDDRNGSGADIFGARVTPTGVVLDLSGFAIGVAEHEQYAPAIAFDGTNYMVVWTDTRMGENRSDIFAARVSPDGTLLDADSFAITTGGKGARYPAITFDGENFFIVWTDSRTGRDQQRIYGARVSSGATVLDPEGVVLSAVGKNSYNPSISFDGTRYLVVWETDNYGNADINGVWVSSEGATLGSEFVLADAEVAEQKPTVISDRNGLSMLAYQHFADDTYRIAGRFIYGGYLNSYCNDKEHCLEGLNCIDNACSDKELPEIDLDDDVFFDDILPDEVMTDADTLIEEPEEVLDADTSTSTDGDKLDADTAKPDNEEPTDEEPGDDTTTDKDTDTAPFDFDLADYGKDNHPGCGCTFVF